jgi:thiol-disulfide isomerase/thioredoxin
MKLSFVFVLLIVCVEAAEARFPDSYKAIAIEPPFSFTERLIDLTPAIARAKTEEKPLFVHLGAKDCPPCRAYGEFLEQHRSDLEPIFRKVLIVDIRTWLKGPALIFKIEDRRYTLDEFKKLVGDKTDRFSYPYYWLLSPELKQIKQLPRGSNHYLSVESHKKLLALDP